MGDRHDAEGARWGTTGSPAAIGVPRFELGASPTRTERATRLRHTPSCDKGDPFSGSSRVGRRLARWPPGTRSSRYANELLEIERFPEFAPAGPAGRRRRRGDDDRVRRLVLARALRAGGRARRAARDRPPRPLLAQRAARRRRAAPRPARGAVPRRRVARSPTTSRSTRTPRSATTPSSPSGSARHRTARSATSASAARSSRSGSSALAERVEAAVGRTPLVLRGGDHEIRRLAVVDRRGRRRR